jgi:hypothetical protein
MPFPECGGLPPLRQHSSPHTNVGSNDILVQRKSVATSSAAAAARDAVAFRETQMTLKTNRAHETRYLFEPSWRFVAASMAERRQAAALRERRLNQRFERDCWEIVVGAEAVDRMRKDGFAEPG